MTRRVSSIARITWCGFSLWLCCSCGGTTPYRSTHEADAAVADVELLTSEGRHITLRQFRGEPLLVYLFATYDLNSQVALMPLTDALARHPSLQILGVAAQPDPSGLLTPYAQSLDIPFPLAFDPTSAVARGASPLGEVPFIPMLIYVDERGRVRDRYVGVPSEGDLECFIRRAGCPGARP